MKMKDCNSSTWNKIFEVPTKAKTKKGQIAALRKHTGFFDGAVDADVLELLDSEFCTVCDDGIIIWVDGEV